MSRPGPATCPFCGKPFVIKVRERGGSNQIYCSKECAIAAHQTERAERKARAFSIRPTRFNYSKRSSDWMKDFVRKACKKYPPLTALEESALIAENRHNRDHLNWLLVMHNLRLVMDTSDKVCAIYDSLDGDDLFMMGVEAMWRAAKKFDPDRGLRFSSYAGEAAKNEIMRMTSRPEFLRERLTTSLDEKLGMTKGEEDERDKIDVIMSQVEEHETPLHEWLEHRDMVAFANEILDETEKKRSMQQYRRFVAGETITSIGRSIGVSRQCVSDILDYDRQYIERTKERLLSRYGEKSLCKTTDWDRMASCAAYKRRGKARTVVERRGPAWVESYIAFERYKLSVKYAARKEEGRYVS